MTDAALIGIDWGTSRIRAHRIGHDGQLLESRSGEAGLSSVRGGDFDSALEALISGWEDTGKLPILMCGMVGSRHGWKEAPYALCPFGIDALCRAVVPVSSRLGEVRIVGGGHAIDKQNHHDIMRGEETQFLGLSDPKGRQVAIAPGTHSKWAFLEDGQITRFRTYMTGELFAVLKTHSILGWLMPDAQAPVIDDTAFETGVKDAGLDQDMLHGLFNVRTSGIFEPGKAQTLSSYLSGLLIGYEVKNAATLFPAQFVTVVAAPALARLYGLALSLLGIAEARHEDVDVVTARGLWRIWQARKDMT